MHPFKTFSEEISEILPAKVQPFKNMLDDFAAGAISYASPIGCINIVAADQNTISHVFFTEYFPFDEPKDLQIQYPVLPRARELLDRYFAGKPLDGSELPIQIDGGTLFQNSVWKTIQQIPYGELRSYKWIAEQIGKPKAVRAVGNAVGANRVSIFRPCHRVIRSNGNLGGYGGGLERKRQLLALEGHASEKFR
jgi:O-6-methylguanine DNA methyltransferase